MAAKVPSHATQLVNLVLKLNAELFHAPNGDVYVTIPKPHPRTYAIGSSAFREFMMRAYYAETKKAVAATSVKDAVGALIGSAREQGKEIPVYLRVAGLDKEVYLDLGDAKHTVIKITEYGWAVEPDPPKALRFIRKPGMLPLPLPVQTKDSLDKLLPQVLNLTSSRDVKFVIAWSIVTLRGKKPYLILSVRGPSGSAKTTACRLIRGLVDPNEVNGGRPPRDTRDLMIAAHSSFVCSLDNVSFIKDDLADDLCSLATGAGFRTRKLTTDSDEAIFSAARPIMFNGIPDLLNRSDLAQRTLVVNLDSIDDKHRKSEREVDARFADLQPRLLGALLNAVSGSLAEESTVAPTKLPRMADAAITVMAAEHALGWTPGTFLKMIQDNDQDNATALLDGNVISDCIKSLPLPWVGETKTLLGLVNIPDMGARKLSSELSRLVGPLREVGIVVELPKQQERSGALRGKRLISIFELHQQLTLKERVEAWERTTSPSASPETPF